MLMYYFGGIEIIMLGRLNFIYMDVVIDINVFLGFYIIGFYENDLVIGVGVLLMKVEEENLFLLLSKIVSEIVDWMI